MIDKQDVFLLISFLIGLKALDDSQKEAISLILSSLPQDITLEKVLEE